MASDAAVATAVFAVVTLSFPFFLYGAWIVLNVEVVTWSVLTRHLRYVLTGLVLTTVPAALWMVPRVLEQLTAPLAVVHAFFGLQAYALLVFGLTGIVRIFQAKRRHDLYVDPDQEVALGDLHEHADHWRKRLRVGVFGYVVFWLLAYLLGATRYYLLYVA